MIAPQPLDRPLAGVLAAPPQGAPGLRLYWLGQAGFVIDALPRHGPALRLVIDPYLSDSLAGKYRGTAVPHIRMMPPPVAPDGICHVDLVLATHHHTDHLDPGTLPALMAANPAARLVAPRAAAALACDRAEVPAARLIAVDAGGRIAPLPGLALTATRGAHEALERDADGHHRFLGFLIAAAGRRILHSGDTIPFPGLAQDYAALAPDVLLLPVNGRDARRRAAGIPGNMTLDEAAALAAACGAGAVIAHHFDMFDFNTVPRDRVAAFGRAQADIPGAAVWLGAQTGLVYRLDAAADEGGGCQARNS